MTIADQITRLQNAKSAIKQSIQNKGVVVSDDATLDSYPALIDSIGGGGGDDLYSEFMNMRTLPGTGYDNIEYLFYGSNIVNEKVANMIETMDTSNVSSIRYVLGRCGYYTDNTISELDLSSWDVSNCSNFSYAFSECNLDHVNISGWDFSSTTSLTSMFSSSKFTSIDMTNCVTDTIKEMSQIFFSTPNLVNVYGELDLSNMSNGTYPSSSTHAFRRASSLETLYLKNIYKNVSMTNNSKYSINLGDTKLKNECIAYIINELPNLASKGITNNTSIIFTLPPTCTLPSSQVQFAADKGWIIAEV